MLDAADEACTLLQRGHVLAIKGIGGYQLACDATQEAVVARLRAAKRRERKPFALMARDLDVIRRYCAPSEVEIDLLRSAAAPIVLVAASTAHGNSRAQNNSRFAPKLVSAAIAFSVAPGVKTLGFMLPNSPLHHLLLRRMNRPIVLTSGNCADEPQCIDDAEARTRLHGLAEYFLAHDRPIARRVDDSVVRVFAGEPRIVRRARGYAPAPIALPGEFAAAPPVLALGAQLKNTFCLLRDGAAIVSHHIGDLENAPSCADFKRNVADYLALFQHEPTLIAVDRHPDYLSRKHGQALAAERALPLIEVQHHHAHIAACLAENQYPLAAPRVIGVALDGLGFGDDGTLWGGEFLLVDYRSSQRLAMFRPVAMPGGEQAMHEPWRNTLAHLLAAIGWSRFALNFCELELFEFLRRQPRELLAKMIDDNINSPRASSCGRLFDAVAAAAGVCRERALYEGQAAIEFEALLDHDALANEDDEHAYPFAISRWQANGLPYIEPAAMWEALLGDLQRPGDRDRALDRPAEPPRRQRRRDPHDRTFGRCVSKPRVARASGCPAARAGFQRAHAPAGAGPRWRRRARTGRDRRRPRTCPLTDIFRRTPCAWASPDRSLKSRIPTGCSLWSTWRAYGAP